MLTQYIVPALEVIVGLGILNVWLIRAGRETAYRGGNAKNMREEFATYGLPSWSFGLIGVMKVTLALALLLAMWNQQLARPAAIGLAVLMLGAFVMHIKVKDPFSKAIPSMAVFAMCLAIALL